MGHTQVRGAIARGGSWHPRRPEFDVPGHSTARFAGHPELANSGYEIERHLGGSSSP